MLLSMTRWCQSSKPATHKLKVVGVLGGRLLVELAIASVLVLGGLVLVQSVVAVAAATAPAELECDFEKYSQGCFNQANFICDTQTNRCRCHPGTPVLIDGHLCVAKAKRNAHCQYDAQCDYEHGYHCLAQAPAPTSTSGARQTQGDQEDHSQHRSQVSLVHCQAQQHHRCRCQLLLDNATATFADDHDADADSTEYRLNSNNNNEQRAQHRGGSDGSSAGRSAHDGDKQDSLNSYSSPKYHRHTHHNHLNHPASGSALSRLVWIFLLLILFVLIALLLLIKYQSFRAPDRSFHPAEDRLSINSELDVPPPYEVAIRFKG